MYHNFQPSNSLSYKDILLGITGLGLIVSWACYVVTTCHNHNMNHWTCGFVK